MGRLIGVADEFAFSLAEDRYFRKRGAFFEVHSEPRDQTAPENVLEKLLPGDLNADG